MDENNIRNILIEKGLKITPQRVIVWDALMNLKDHPTADHIITEVRKENPNIAVGTIYKILETFVEHGIIERVKTEKDTMRYEAVTDKHHHLYCVESGKIDDYYDDELDEMLKQYFRNKKIENFKIEDYKLQITGKFINK
jgi:Fur family peroxide stress response transcriptional regulator